MPLPSLEYYDNLYAKRKVNQPIVADPLADELVKERNREIREGLFLSASPDTIARVNKISRAVGEPPVLVEDRVDAYEKAIANDRFMSVVQEYPTIAKWAVSNPRGAAAAVDDWESLSLLGKAWQGFKNVGSSVKVGGVNLVGLSADGMDWLRELTDTVLYPLDAALALGVNAYTNAAGIDFKLDPDKYRQNARNANVKRRAEVEALKQAERPDVDNWVAKNLLAGVENIPLSLAAIATRNPSVATGMVGGLVAGGEYQTARDAGLSPARASVYGATQGTIEAISEKIPISRLLSDIGKKSPIGKTLINQLVAELPGEQAATFLQDMNEWGTLNPDKTLSEFIAERPSAAAETFVQTLGAVGTTVGATKAAERTIQATIKISDRVTESRRAKKEAGFLDEVMKASEKFKLRESDPEEFKEMLKVMAEENGIANIYVSGEALQEYMQSDAYDPDGPLSNWVSQVEEAAATDGDVLMPIEEAAVVLQPAWAILRDDVRLSAGGVSRREAQAIDEAMAEVMDELATSMAEQDKATAKKLVPIEKLATSINQKLQNAGYTPSTAKIKAYLLVQRYATRVERLGKELTGNEFDVTVNYVLPEGLANARTFNQDGKGGPRATITFPAQAFGDGPVIINLFNSRNLSSFLHESGHLFLEELKADASLPDAPDSVKQDWAIVSAWFAENGHSVDGAIPADAHELWARGFERYLMEGKAPASSVQAVFDTMRSWLIAIYRRVENLMAPINNDIRQVMDRLIATDEEISDVSAAQKLDPMFETSAAAGMTGPEFDAYMELVASAKSTARTEVLEKTMRVLKARDTRHYKALEADIRAEVVQMVDARPEIRALAEARKAPLNSQWIIDRFGQDALSLLPKSVPPVHKTNGANPELLGELTGVENGRALVQTLMGLEQQRKTMRANGDKRSVRLAMIEQETADTMAERYGDPFNDGSIEEEALAAVHNDIQGEVIAAEIRALARKTRQRATPYSVARTWARQKVRSGKVRDHLTKAAIQQYRRNAATNATDAFTALAEGRNEDAFRHKQAQLVNNALVREARDAMEELQDALKRLEKTARKATIASVDQDYLDQAHTLLEAVDLRKRSQRAVDRQGKFEAWARDREAEGFDIAVPPSFEATIGQTNWTRLSAEELLGLDAAVKQILHLGRLKQTLLDNQEERDFDAVVGEALSTMDRLPKRAPRDMTDPGKLDQFKSFVLGSHAALLKMETVFTRLDGGKGGAFDRVVFQPISEAQAAEKRMMREYLAELDGHLNKVPKVTLATWEDKLTIEDLYDKETGEPVRTERGKLISMALNMGNEGNAAKLAGGYGWSEDRVMRVLNRELTAPEWQYVQSVWDTINKLWPRVAELERRVNGVVPEKVQPRELQTPAGTLAGGYFPVVYDASRNLRVEALSAESTDKLFGNSYSRATTSQGFTKARTDVERPINLSLDVMTRHVAEVIHDITHREPIMQADRFLSSERIAKAVNETLGADVRKQFRPWLQHIANEWAYDRAGMSAFESFLKATRRNTTFVGMGFRVSTMLVQAGGYANSFERVGALWVLEGLNLFLRNPRSTAEFVLERSLEVRDRTESLDRDIRDNVRSAIGKRDLPSAIRRYAFAGIGFMDRVVVIPTWLGAYNKALASGAEEDAAIHVADSAVRESQGSGAAKDLASVQRGKGNTGEVMKLLTMFYTFQSAQYQRFVNLGWDISDSVRERRADLVPEIAARSWWMLVVGPVLGALLTGQTPDDEEGWGEWAAKLSLFNLSGPVPIARDVVPLLGKKLSGDQSFPYRFTPAAGAFEAAERVAGDVKNVAEGDDTKRATRNALELIGYSTGLVPGQAAASAQFIVDVLSGDADPEGLGDWWEGLTKGRLKD